MGTKQKRIVYLCVLFSVMVLTPRMVHAQPRIEMDWVPDAKTNGLESAYFNFQSAGTASLRFMVPVAKDYYKMEGEMQGKIDKGLVKVWINGKEAEWRLSGGGSTLEEHFFRFTVWPGNTGPKRVKIRVDDKSAEIHFEYQAVPGLIIGSPPDDAEGIFGQENQTVHWDGFYLAPKSVRVRVNEQDAPPWFLAGGPDNYHLDGTVSAAFHEGKNSVEVDATDATGNTRSVQRDFYFYPHNRVRLNDVFFLREGRMRPRMGPFYHLTLKGDSLVEVHTDEPYPHTAVRISQSGYFSCLKAVKTGKCMVTIWETKWISRPQNKVLEIPVEVIGK